MGVGGVVEGHQDAVGRRPWPQGDEEARGTKFRLDFLTPGKRYLAEIYRDADDADYRTDKRHAMVIERREVTSAGAMDLKIAPGGGLAIRFKALK